ncbi:MAG: hypothetical protein LBK54_12015 [Propionibacteriaceae bacterium]|nr:hypothetical protein [Propionibacteriaceae bacterium]
MIHTFYVLYMSSQPIASKNSFIPQTYLDQLIPRAGQYWNRETNGAIDSFTYDWNDGVATWQMPANYTLWEETQTSVVYDGALPYAAQVFPEAGFQADPVTWPTTSHLLILVRSDDPGLTGSPMAGQANYPSSRGLSNGGYARLLVNPPSGTYTCGSTNPNAALWGFCYAPVFEHEFGHNLGLGHSGEAICPAPTYDGSFTGSQPTCTNELYYDTYDIMGGPGSGYLQALPGHRKAELGLLESGIGMAEVSTPSSQSFTLVPLEDQDYSSLNEIEIIDPTDPSAVYSIEFREGLGVRILRVYPETPNPNADRTAFLSPTLNTKNSWGGVQDQFLTQSNASTSDSFVSASGQIRVTVTSVTSDNAVVNVTVNQPVTGADDCGASITSYCAWVLSATGPSTITRSLATPSDHDFIGFVVPATGVWTFTSSATPAGADLKAQVLFLPWGYTSTLYWGNDGAVGWGDFIVSTTLIAGEMVFLDISNVSATTSVTADPYTVTATLNPADDCASVLEGSCSWTLNESGSSSITKGLEFSGDEDWIAVTVPAAGTWTITGSFPTGTSLRVGVIGPLYQGRALLLGSYAGTSSPMSFTYTSASAGTVYLSITTYYLRPSMTANPYVLTATPTA